MFFKNKDFVSISDVRRSKREKIETYYANLNWNFHAKPIILEVIEEFEYEIKEKLKDRVFHNILKEQGNGRIKTDKTIYGDSITIYFGQRPLPCRPTILKPGVSMEVLVEKGPSLVFSCAFNGSVAAFIYPQETDCSHSSRNAYVVSAWRNSREFNKSDIRRVFKLFIQIYLFGSSYISSKKSAKVYAKLEAKHLQTLEGKNAIIGYLYYLKYIINGLRKIYGIAKP